MIFINYNIFHYVIKLVNKKPKVDVTIDAKLEVELIVKLAIKTRQTMRQKGF